MSEESRRKQVTLVCFILANIIFASLLIYLDSYSTYTWDYETNVGPATMFMQSEEDLPSIDDLENVPGIERVAKMEKSWCSLVAFPPDQNATTTAEKGFTLAQGGGAHDPNINLTVAAIENNQDLFTDFPSIFNITEGRWPTRNIECALAQWLIDFYGVELGAIVTFESGFVHEYHFFRVVGIFDHPEDDNRNYAYYNLGDIVVMPEFVSQRERMHYAYLKVNDYFLSPLQPAAALSYLSDIEEDVRYLDPQYELFHHTTFSLDDIQSRGIQRYIEKAALTKTSQLIRSQIAIFIGVILSVSTVRYNSQKQEKRAELLLARGASSRQIILVKIREILSLSLLAAAASVGVGILISRVGLLSEGFFVLRTISISEMPVLVTLESLAVIIVYAVIIPLVAFAGISISSREKDTEHIELGKLARFVGALRFFRWDALVVLISFGFLFGLWEVGNQILRTPLFSAIIYTIPVFLMIGLASLLSKAAQTSSFYISKGLSKFLPRIGAEVGGRRIGRDRKVSGFTILVFALVTSLMWSNIIVNATLPNTALGHARFALSGDVAFNLDADFYDMFDEVRENLSLVPGVVSTTMVNVYSYSLSSSLLDTVDFAVIDTDDIDSVAYDETGIPLENSYLSEIVT
ncbi:MAG: FtsX-like permease family protein, partial [Candidatus Thorarchaeota archaeon]